MSSRVPRERFQRQSNDCKQNHAIRCDLLQWHTKWLWNHQTCTGCSSAVRVLEVPRQAELCKVTLHKPLNICKLVYQRGRPKFVPVCSSHRRCSAVVDSYCLADVFPNLVQVSAFELSTKLLFMCLSRLAAANATLAYAFCFAHRCQPMQMRFTRYAACAMQGVNKCKGRLIDGSRPNSTGG